MTTLEKTARCPDMHTRRYSLSASPLSILRALMVPLLVLATLSLGHVTRANAGTPASPPATGSPVGAYLSAQDILRQVDRNMQPESCERYVRLTNRLPNGREKVLTLYTAKGKGQKAIALIISPDTLKGRAILRLGPDVWQHIPGEMTLRRSALDQSFMGGVFNNVDILMVDFSADFQPTLLEEKADSYLLALTPRVPSMPYAKMLMRVNRKLMIPQTLVQYGRGGSVMKTISFEQISATFGAPRPEIMTTRSALNDRYVSTWHLGSIKPREFLAEAFSKSLLPRVGLLLK